MPSSPFSDYFDPAPAILSGNVVPFRSRANNGWSFLAFSTAATASTLVQRDASGGITGAAFTASGVTISAGTVIVSTPFLNCTQTWNAGGVTFTGCTFNITDTASASGSLLIDLQKDSTSRLSVGKLGDVTINAAGSSTSSPRSIALTTFSPGEAGRLNFGIDLGFQGGYGVNMQLYAYHGLDVQCGSTSLSAPSYITGSSGAYAMKPWGKIALSDSGGTTDVYIGRAGTNTMLVQADSGASVAPTQQFQGQSSTTSGRGMASVVIAWASSVDASRKGRMTLIATDASGDREGFRVEASGSAPMISFYGATAVVKPTVSGAKGGNAALGSLMTALSNLGLVTDSTSA